MSKEIWKPGNMLYPLPVVMVSVAEESGKQNIITRTSPLCNFSTIQK